MRCAAVAEPPTHPPVAPIPAPPPSARAAFCTTFRGEAPGLPRASLVAALFAFDHSGVLGPLDELDVPIALQQ